MTKNGEPLRITVSKNGPYLVSNDVPIAKQHIIINAQGESLEWREGEHFARPAPFALCRCGHSNTKPFCDGTHKKIGFDGTETANREPYLQQAKEFDGPTMVLKDAEPLCAFARFCDPQGQVWNLIERTDKPEPRRLVEHEAGHCPSGRLVAVHRATGQAIEPHFEPSIGLIEDTAKAVSGPLWVRGKIPVVSADGHAYEVRNRVTLCRCGRSKNKPYCDGSHAAGG